MTKGCILKILQFFYIVRALRLQYGLLYCVIYSNTILTLNYLFWFINFCHLRTQRQFLRWQYCNWGWNWSFCIENSFKTTAVMFVACLAKIISIWVNFSLNWMKQNNWNLQYCKICCRQVLELTLRFDDNSILSRIVSIQTLQLKKNKCLNFTRNRKTYSYESNIIGAKYLRARPIILRHLLIC